MALGACLIERVVGGSVMTMASELIAAIVEHPELLEHWTIYADWLLDRDDPRGELINVAIAIEGGLDDVQARRRHYTLTDRERLLSPALFAQSHHWYFEFWRGFIRKVTLHRDDESWPGAEAVAVLFADPHVGLLEHLVVPEIGADLAPLFDAPRRHIRMLEIDWLHDDRLDHGLPALDTLVLQTHEEGRGSVPLSHARLRRLVGDSRACLAACTGELHVPRLEELVWKLSTDDDLVLDRRSILHHPPATLRSLEIVDGPGFSGDLTAICESTAVAQLTSLTFEVLETPQLEELAALAPRLAHLERLEFGVMFLPDEAPDPGPDTAQLQALASVLQAAMPRTHLEFSRERPEFGGEPVAEAASFDEQSRGADGRIDAIAAFNAGKFR
jgi:uncharacterized protein (TIGR02996 family)